MTDKPLGSSNGAISAGEVRAEATRRGHVTNADHPATCLKCWLLEVADTIESLQVEVEKLRAVVEMVASDHESIAEQAEWNRRHPSMTNEFVVVHISGEGAPERLSEALS